MSNECDTRDITALVLAGGQGSRVGGVDKGLLPFQGRAIVAHVCERIRPQVQTLLISCNRNPEAYGEFADGVFADTREDFPGPLAGLEAAAAHITTPYTLVVPCDSPKLPSTLAHDLLQALQASNASCQACYVFDGEREQYLTLLAKSSALISISAQLDAGHRSVRHWLNSVSAQPVDFSAQAEAFANFNERTDFE